MAAPLFQPLACSVMHWSVSMYDYVRAMDARGKCIVIVHILRMKVEYAFMANSTFGQGFGDDYNMGHGPVGHPGVF